MKNHPFGHGGKHDKIFFIGMLICGGCPQALYAADFAYGLGYTATSSSNITRVPVNERHEWINSLLAGAIYAESTPTVTARVLAQAEYRNYSKNVFGDETLFNMNANAVWTLSPQRFTWTVDDAYRQLLVDVTAATTPANRTNTNTFDTGPDFYLRFTPVNSLALGARVGNFYTARGDTDNDRFSGYASWLYQATASTTYSLNYQMLDVNYDNDTLNTNFIRHDLFLRARTRPSRSEFILDLGASDINRARGNDPRETLTRLSWVRQLTPESTLSLILSKESSDVGTDILTTSVVTNVPVTPGQVTTTPPALAQDVVTGDVYVTKRSEIIYTHHGSKVGATFSLFKRDLNFEATPMDRKETGGHLELSFLYFGTSTAAFFSDYAKTEYLDFFRRDTDKDSGLRFSYLVRKSLTLGLEGHHIVRTSTASTLDFVENRVLFSVLYSSGPLFTPQPGR